MNVVDLVVSLGGVDLFQVAQALPHGKPALCVLGPDDNRQVRRSSGCSTAAGSLPGMGPGRISQAASDSAKARASTSPTTTAARCSEICRSASIFFTHAYPQELRESGTDPRFGMPALDTYLQAKPPIYHFYAHPQFTMIEEYGQCLSIGVNGIFQPPTALEFV